MTTMTRRPRRRRRHATNPALLGATSIIRSASSAMAICAAAFALTLSLAVSSSPSLPSMSNLAFIVGAPKNIGVGMAPPLRSGNRVRRRRARSTPMLPKTTLTFALSVTSRQSLLLASSATSSSPSSSSDDDAFASSSSSSEPPSPEATLNAKVKKAQKTQPPNSNKNPWTVHDADLLHRPYHPKRTPTSQKPIDYVIVGSGIGGLWLGACLAKFNVTSLVLEQHYVAGGLQHTFTRRRYEFVPGLHYLANLELCRPLYEMVADANFVETMSYTQAGCTTAADEAFEGSSHDLQIGNLPLMHVRSGVNAVRSELTKHFPKERKAIDEFLRIVEKAKWQAGQFATFRIFPPWLQFLLSNVMCSTYIKYASQTTEEALSALTSDGRLRTVLSAFGGDLGESIADGSFAMQAAVLGHVMEGCHYPVGGPIQFARGLIPTIRNAGGDVLVKARVEEILIENGRATGVKLANGDIVRARKGVVSDAGMGVTLSKLLPSHVVQPPHGPLSKLHAAVTRSSGGISHAFLFVGFNATSAQLNLTSSSHYYIPWNATSESMDASAIQDYYRDTLLDPTVEDVSAGIVFASAKDPYYTSVTMPGKSTAIVFSEARDADFLSLLEQDEADAALHEGVSRKRRSRSSRYEQAKALVERKMMKALLQNFPHVKPYVDVVVVGTPLTIAEYTMRTETLGLRHTPTRMTDMDLRPDTAVPGLYFTGQDVAFAGWAGAMTGAMVTAQCLLGYTLWDFMNERTLMRDLGAGHVEDMIQRRVKEGTASNPFEVASEICENALRHVRWKLEGKGG